MVNKAGCSLLFLACIALSIPTGERQPRAPAGPVLKHLGLLWHMVWHRALILSAVVVSFVL